MSLNKAIESGKEHRKQYRGCMAFDPTCRDNRMYMTEKRMPVDDNGSIICKHPKLDAENIFEISIDIESWLCYKQLTFGMNGSFR